MGEGGGKPQQGVACVVTCGGGMRGARCTQYWQHTLSANVGEEPILQIKYTSL